MSRPGADVPVTEATGQDVAAFADFFRRAWHESGPGDPGFAGATDELIAELTEPAAVRERIGGPDARMFLAWQYDTVIGFAANKRIDQRAVELAGIIVLRFAAGRGVGTALVAAATAAARADGYRTMIVRTETDNERALDFYRARGFVPRDTAVEEVDGTAVEVRELALGL